MNSIILVVDRLHAGYLGCYGNTWVVTPEFNRLASESFVFDQAIVDATSLGSIYRAYWTGRHALEELPADPLDRWTLPQLLSKSGVGATLLTDLSLPDAPWAHIEGLERIEIPLPSEPQTAADAGETHLAGFFAAAADWLDRAPAEPFCLWLHTQGLAAPWDAPLEYRNQYADEDEPLPPADVEAPYRALPADFDPDELTGVAQAYAGQVTLLDECLGGFLELFRTSPLANDTMLIVMSVRGFALGEHQRIGAWDAALHGELIHVPWIVRLPDGTGSLARTQALVQPPDMAATLLDWHKIAVEPQRMSAVSHSLLPIVRDEVETVRDRAIAVSNDGERGIRTPAWYLRTRIGEPLAGDELPPTPGEPLRLLYAMPDDRWEANDVSSRCPEVVESLEKASAEFAELSKTGRLAELSPLEDSLVAEHR
jgi:arylsulfatase A-like enzyme